MSSLHKREPPNSNIQCGVLGINLHSLESLKQITTQRDTNYTVPAKRNGTIVTCCKMASCWKDNILSEIVTVDTHVFISSMDS